MPLRALALAALLATGCSALFVKGPPPGPPACTMSRIVPFVDTAVAVLAAVGALYFVADDSVEHRSLGVVVEGGIALGFGLGAWSGHGRVSRCLVAPPAGS